MTEHKDSWPTGTPCWTDLMVTDLVRSRAFYAEVLGWSFSDPQPEYGGYCTALVDGRRAAGLSPTTEGMEDVPHVWTVYLATSHLAATAQTAVAAGATTLVEPAAIGPLGTMGVWRDPTGAVFGLWQSGTHTGFDVVDEPGAVAWCDLMTRDPAGARDFYAQLFGYSYEDIGSEEMPYATFTVPAGDRPAGGIGGMDPRDENTPPVWSVCFQVPDVDATVQGVRDAGGSVMEDPFEFDFGRLALVAGPDRETFAVMTPGRPM